MSNTELQKSSIPEAMEKFRQVASTAKTSISLLENVENTFAVSQTIIALTNILTDEVIDKYFKPLMNRKCGFLTDRDPKKIKKALPPYSNETIRDCIIDATVLGLSPTQNQMNIIAGNMYPTSEGFSYLLKKEGITYSCNILPDAKKVGTDWVFKFEMGYSVKNGATKLFKGSCSVKEQQYSSIDNLRGKAKKKAKQQLFEFCTSFMTSGEDEADVVIDGSGNVEINKTQTETKANFGEDAEEVEEIKNEEPKKKPNEQPKQQDSLFPSFGE